MDPAAPSAGDPATINRYAYCAGDPVGASDPTGAVIDDEANSWQRNLKKYGGDSSAAHWATLAERLPISVRRSGSKGKAKKIASWLETQKIDKRRINIGGAGELGGGVIINIVCFDDTSWEQQPTLEHHMEAYEPLTRPNDHPVAVHPYVTAGLGAGGWWTCGEGWQDDGQHGTIDGMGGLILGAGGSWHPGNGISPEGGLVIGGGLSATWHF